MANNLEGLSKYITNINRTSWTVDVPSVMPVYADGLLSMNEMMDIPKSQEDKKRVCMGCVKWITQENSALQPDLSQMWCRDCAVEILVARNVVQISKNSQVVKYE